MTPHLRRAMIIDELIDSGCTLEVWDMSKIFGYRKNHSMDSSETFLRKFSKKNSVFQAIEMESQKSTIFIPYMNIGTRSIWLYKALKRNNVFIVFFAIGCIPSAKVSTKRMRHLFKRINLHTLENFFKHFWVKAISRLYGLNSHIFQLVFAAGRKAARDFENECKILEINYIDYDKFLMMKDYDERKNTKSYIAFIDEAYPNHPDEEFDGLKKLDSENYLSGMRKFFDMLEQRFEMEVIIAAHPKSAYDNCAFGQRKIINGATNELIKDSRFVILHDSTAVSYAVLYEKPMMFVFNNQLTSLRFDSNYSSIIAFHKELGGELINIDNINDLDVLSIPIVDKEKYNLYKYEYLTSPKTENRYTKDIIIDFLKDFKVQTNPEIF